MEELTDEFFGLGISVEYVKKTVRNHTDDYFISLSPEGIWTNHGRVHPSEARKSLDEMNGPKVSSCERSENIDLSSYIRPDMIFMYEREKCRIIPLSKRIISRYGYEPRSIGFYQNSARQVQLIGFALLEEDDIKIELDDTRRVIKTECHGNIPAPLGQNRLRQFHIDEIYFGSGYSSYYSEFRQTLEGLTLFRSSLRSALPQSPKDTFAHGENNESSTRVYPDFCFDKRGRVKIERRDPTFYKGKHDGYRNITLSADEIRSRIRPEFEVIDTDDGYYAVEPVDKTGFVSITDRVISQMKSEQLVIFSQQARWTIASAEHLKGEFVNMNKLLLGFKFPSDGQRESFWDLSSIPADRKPQLSKELSEVRPVYKSWTDTKNEIRRKSQDFEGPEEFWILCNEKRSESRYTSEEMILILTWDIWRDKKGFRGVIFRRATPRQFDDSTDFENLTLASHRKELNIVILDDWSLTGENIRQTIESVQEAVPLNKIVNFYFCIAWMTKQAIERIPGETPLRSRHRVPLCHFKQAPNIFPASVTEVMGYLIYSDYKIPKGWHGVIPLNCRPAPFDICQQLYDGQDFEKLVSGDQTERKDGRSRNGRGGFSKQNINRKRPGRK